MKTTTDSSETSERIAYLGKRPGGIRVDRAAHDTPRIMTFARRDGGRHDLAHRLRRPLLDVCLRAGERVAEGVTLVQLERTGGTAMSPSARSQRSLFLHQLPLLLWLSALWMLLWGS